MAVKHGKNLDHTINTVSVEDFTKGVEISIDNDVVEASAAGDAAKEHIEGIYGWVMDGDYNWNPASGKNDATIFALLGAGAKAIDVTPGGGAAAAENPKYEGNAILKSYKISIPHDGLITSKASYQGTGALSRTVA